MAQSPHEDSFDRLWRALSSVKLALALIGLLAFGALALTLVMQAPASGLSSSDPGAYQRWVDSIRGKYGPLTDLLSFLGLFDVVSALWFRLVLALLVVNVLVCTLNRWPAVWRRVSEPPVRVHEGFLMRQAHRAALTLPGLSAAEAADGLRHILRQRRYRVLTRSEEGRIYLYADRYRFARLGTFLHHAGVVLILAGALGGGLLGFREQGLVVPEGTTVPVGHGTNLAVYAEDFTDEYYPSGQPKDYYSDLILYENGVEAKRQRIRVNEPMDYRGVRFYQAFFGPAVYLQVHDADGRLLADQVVPLDFRFRDRPAGGFAVPERGLRMVVVWTAGLGGMGDLALLGFRDNRNTPALMGTLSQGPAEARTFEGLRFTLRDIRQFTGLQVAKNPGLPLIWTAAGLMVLGFFAVFYFPHRRVWAVCAAKDGVATALAAGQCERDPAFGREFARLVHDAEERIRQLKAEASRVALVGMHDSF